MTKTEQLLFEVVERESDEFGHKQASPSVDDHSRTPCSQEDIMKSCCLALLLSVGSVLFVDVLSRALILPGMHPKGLNHLGRALATLKLPHRSTAPAVSGPQCPIH